LKFAPTAIPAMALLQQHDARWDIVIEPAARRHAAIEAWGHSELGAQSGHKNPPACVDVCQPVTGNYSTAGPAQYAVCTCVDVCQPVTGNYLTAGPAQYAVCMCVDVCQPVTGNYLTAGPAQYAVCMCVDVCQPVTGN